MCDRWPKTMPGDPPVRSSPNLGMITNDVETGMSCTIPLRLADVLTLEVEESNTFWPATPESTPRDSPRGVAMSASKWALTVLPLPHCRGTGMLTQMGQSYFTPHGILR